jgi:hypothetical protein
MAAGDVFDLRVDDDRRRGRAAASFARGNTR